MPASRRASADARQHELFGLPFDEFTDARNRLVKELRSEGRAD